jgi:hypothetical protein
MPFHQCKKNYKVFEKFPRKQAIGSFSYVDVNITRTMKKITKNIFFYLNNFHELIILVYTYLFISLY